MKHAVSLVLFRSQPELVIRTVRAALNQTRPPDILQVLVSGTDEEDPLAQALVTACSVNTVTSWSVAVRPDNLGFAGGHNYLAEKAFAAGAEWVTLLNPDLELDEDAFERYWNSVEGYAGEFAIHGPQLVSGRGDGDVVDSAGIVWTQDARHFDAWQGEPIGCLPDHVIASDGVTGAVLTVSRSTHARLMANSGEFLDDVFLAYREDAELGVRVQLMGGRCLIHPAQGFKHQRGAGNAERTSALQRTLGVQNRFLIRSRLGPYRPGGAASALIRDLVVVAAVLTWERSSITGLSRAWAVRRYERYKGRAASRSGPTLNCPS